MLAELPDLSFMKQTQSHHATKTLEAVLGHSEMTQTIVLRSSKGRITEVNGGVGVGWGCCSNMQQTVNVCQEIG